MKKVIQLSSKVYHFNRATGNFRIRQLSQLEVASELELNTNVPLHLYSNSLQEDRTSPGRFRKAKTYTS